LNRRTAERVVMRNLGYFQSIRLASTDQVSVIEEILTYLGMSNAEEVVAVVGYAVRRHFPGNRGFCDRGFNGRYRGRIRTRHPRVACPGCPCWPRRAPPRRINTTEERGCRRRSRRCLATGDGQPQVPPPKNLPPLWNRPSNARALAVESAY